MTTYDVFLSHASDDEPAGAVASTVASAVPYRAKLPGRDFFVHRRELDEIRDLLTRAAGLTVGITTALRGAGGFGKTALARTARRMAAAPAARGLAVADGVPARP